MVLLAILLIWRLVDLFRKKGHWKEEAEQELSMEVR